LFVVIVIELLYLLKSSIEAPVDFSAQRLALLAWGGRVESPSKRRKLQAAKKAEIGSLGPALAALILTYNLEGKEGIRRLLGRLLLCKTNIVWWLLCSSLAVVLQLAPFQNIVFQAVFSLINIPAIISFLQMPLLLGMVGEELGWRGFALPRLLSKYNPIVSSLILAVPWMFWHVPLAIFPDWRGNLPITHFFARYALLLLPLTLIFTWFSQKTKGSILLVIVFHRALNLAFNAYSSVIGLTEESDRLLSNSRIVVLWLVAAGIAMYYFYSGMKTRYDTSYGRPVTEDSSV
jgi:membrane protease YdiL (CAAX protease family)